MTREWTDLPLLVRDFTDADDLYNFSMGFVAQQWPDARVRYRYTNRDRDFRFPPGFVHALRAQIEKLSELRFGDESLAFFQRATPWLPLPYLQWLRQYRFDPSLVQVVQDGGDLAIEISGRWYEAIYWEVKLLAIISELAGVFHADDAPAPLVDGWQDVLHEKARRLSAAGVTWTDFGTRRRASFEVQDAVVGIMKGYDGFRGTSNPYLAMKHGVRPIGTYAHQLPMALQALYGAGSADRMAMEHWVGAFRGNLGIALSDTLTTEHFLRSFDSYYANLFTGVRQDSGDPIEFGERIIAHYKNLGIDPTTKQIMFSDGLDVDRAIRIHEHFRRRIRTGMGIGTHLTADPAMTGRKPMNHVIKLVEADFGSGPLPVIKLSDEPGKHSGDPAVVEAVMRLLGLHS